MKEIKIWKEEIKLSLFTGDLTLYIENSKDSTKKLLDLISEFGKAAGNQVHIQKSVAFLYTNNDLLERKIMWTIPFTITIIKTKGT